MARQEQLRRSSDSKSSSVRAALPHSTRNPPELFAELHCFPHFKLLKADVLMVFLLQFLKVAKALARGVCASQLSVDPACIDDDFELERFVAHPPSHLLARS
eukprot:1648877-Pleurochrysis_carterae.AAC.1